MTESMAIPWLGPLVNKIQHFLQELIQALKVWLRKPAIPFRRTCFYLGTHALHFRHSMVVIAWYG